MATLQLTNLEGSLLEYFKTIANQKGIDFVVINKPIEKVTQETDNKVTDSADRPPKNLSEALLNLPTIEGYDDEDIFARDYQQYSPHREIDWTI